MGELRLHRILGKTMGTEFRATFAATDPDLPVLGRRLKAAVDAVDRAMSTWKPDSDLSRVNRGVLNEWVPVPMALAQVVAAGLAVSLATQGAFDMTLGQAVNAWGFGPQPIADLPSQAQPLGRYRALASRLDPPALARHAPFLLDLSGIAKGFGVDEMALVLEEEGVAHYLVEIDGEVRAKGRKPGLEGDWTVALDAPLRQGREAWDVLPVRDCALATSGDYRRFVAKDGRHFSHTIDGRTGWPVKNAVASVTVAHRSCMLADAWASALMVLGERDGPAVAEAQNIAALFLIRKGDAVEERRTSHFPTD